MVGLDVKLVNFKFISLARFTNEAFGIASYAIEFHWVFGIFGLPHEVEAVLANRMAEMF